MKELLNKYYKTVKGYHMIFYPKPWKQRMISIQKKILKQIISGKEQIKILK